MRNITSESTNVSNCNKNDELYKFVNSIPKDTVDGIVSGHTHSIVHIFINGIPII